MNKEIVLTYVPSSSEKNRICGHTFEVMDYFLLFYDLGYLNVKILIQEAAPKNLFYNAWEDKYNLPNNYKDYIIFSTHKIIISKNILIYTGGFFENDESKYNLIYKKLLFMRCAEYYNYKNIDLKNFNVLEDTRVYSHTGLSKNSIHYTKKIYFKRYKDIIKSDNKTLVYINSNLRKIPENILKEKEKYLIITGDSQIDESYLKAPVPKLFEKFDTFLYTETTKQFDCSPRLIAECQFYNKKVNFNFNTSDYFKKDTGLRWRWYDIKNNFKSLELNENDDIIKLIRD